jgi:excisionase family DNA binding protein
MPPHRFRNTNSNGRQATELTQATSASFVDDPSVPGGESYLTPAESAQYLRSSTSTLAKLRLKGDGPVFTRIGRVIRYRRSDLDRWMSDKLARSTSKLRARG